MICVIIAFRDQQDHDHYPQPSRAGRYLYLRHLRRQIFRATWVRDDSRLYFLCLDQILFQPSEMYPRNNI